MERKKNTGVNKTRISKTKIRPKSRIRMNFRKIVPAIIDYLKSDSYLYSHLMISSTSLYDYPARHDVFFSSGGKPILKIEDSVNEKLVEYLKSDMYLLLNVCIMVLNLGIGRDCDNGRESTFVGNADGLRPNISVAKISVPVCSPVFLGQELQFMRVTSTVLSKKIAWQTKEVAENPVVEKRRVQGSEGIPHDASVISPQTPALQEVKKHGARRSSRLSTASG